MYPFFSSSRLKKSLESRGGAILKSKGQNFLIDPNAVRLIASGVFSLLPDSFSVPMQKDAKSAVIDQDLEAEAQEKGPGLGAKKLHGSARGIETLEFLEIGPGTGALSFAIWDGLQELAMQHSDMAIRWVGLELDPVLCSILSEETIPAWNSGLEEISERGDQDWRTLESKTWKKKNLELTLHRTDARNWIEHRKHSDPMESCLRIICGNLPYYISTELLLQSMDLRPDGCAFLVQKEYALRILETRKSSSISVFVRNQMKPEKGASIAKGCFLPPPSVESTVLIMRKIAMQCHPELLEQVLRKSFSGKRKTMRNSWKNSMANSEVLELWNEVASTIGLDPGRRAEDLQPDEFFALANALENAGVSRETHRENDKR